MEAFKINGTIEQAKFAYQLCASVSGKSIRKKYFGRKNLIINVDACVNMEKGIFVLWY